MQWTKLICNAYEPDNRLHYHGDIEHKDSKYFLHIRRISFAGYFRDGFMNFGLDLVSGEGNDGGVGTLALKRVFAIASQRRGQTFRDTSLTPITG
jgi:hypothetical protein